MVEEINLWSDGKGISKQAINQKTEPKRLYKTQKSPTS